VLLSGDNQGPNLGESQMPYDGDFTMLGPDQLPPNSPQDMPSNNNQQPPQWEGVGEEHADDPAHTDWPDLVDG